MKPETLKRIADLEFQVKANLAGQAHVYHFADHALTKLTTQKFTGSGVILTMESLNGKTLVEPTLIRDGLSDELIKALRQDFFRSYELANFYKPRKPE